MKIIDFSKNGRGMHELNIQLYEQPNNIKQYSIAFS